MIFDRFYTSRWRVFWSVKFNQIEIDYQFYPLPVWIEYKYSYVLVLLLLRITLFCLVEMVLFSSLLDKLSPWLEGGIKLWLVFVRSLHEDQVLSFGSCFRVQVRIQKILSYHKGQCSDKIRSLALQVFSRCSILIIGEEDLEIGGDWRLKNMQSASSMSEMEMIGIHMTGTALSFLD